ncbi:MAG: PAS domain S-box protein [Nitrospirae bacterium]|nr:PAS domain S-box protein [Nitrospirota bacterium]
MKKPALDIRSYSIRAKMFLFISLLITIVVVSFFIFTDLTGVPFTDIESDYHKVLDEAVASVNQIADVRKENVNRRILRFTSNIETFVKSNLTKSYISNGESLAENHEFIQYLEDYRTTFNIFDNIQVADIQSGKIIASTRSKDIGRDVSYVDYFKGAMKSRRYHICFAFDPTDGAADLYVSHVLDVDSQPRYIIIMNVTMSDFMAALSYNIQRGDTSETILANNDGLLLVSLKHKLPSGEAPVPLQYKVRTVMMERALDANEGTIIGTDYKGTKVLAAYRYIPIDAATGWGLVVKRDYSEVLAPYYTKLRYVIVLILCYLTAALIVANIIIRWQTRPIFILTKAACEVGKGRLDTVVTVESKDELGQLAYSFNKMVREIRESHIELSRRRDFLQKVLDNTTNAVYSIDLAGNFLLTNYKVSCITGYSADELIGRPFSILFDNDVLPQVNKQFIRASVDGERVVNYEIELTRKDAAKRIIIFNVTPVYENEKIEMLIGTAEDITELKELEYQIKRSEIRLRAIFEQSPVGIVIVESQFGRFVAINQAFCDIVGYSMEEMSKLTFQEITHPDDLAVSLANRKKLVEGDIDKFSAEKRYIHKNGGVVWVKIVVVSLWVEGEASDCHLAIVEDITKQREMEELRRVNEKRLEAMVQLHQMAGKPVNEIMDFVLQSSLDLTGSAIGFINFGNEDESEYVPGAYSVNVMKECAVKRDELRFPIEHAGLWAEAVRRRGPVIVNNYETTTLNKRGCPQGHMPLKSLMVVPTFDSGRIAVLTAVGNKDGECTQTDVNQLTILMDWLWQNLEHKRLTDAVKAAGLYSRNLIETSLDPLITITHGGKISDVNAATESITGCSRDELIGTNFSNYFTEPDKAEAGYRRVFDYGEVRDYELGIRHRNGNITPVLYNASVYKDEAGTVIGVFAAARDISEQKRMEEELRRFNEELSEKVKEETNKRLQGEQLLRQQSKMAAMGEMISLIAHQWKQPLNVIAITAQDLKDAYVYGELDAGYLNKSQRTIIDHVEFMVNTVSDFRKFLLPSKEKVQFDIKKAIEELVGMFSSYFMKDSIFINITSDEGVFFNSITGYPNEFKQVILNIINNARDAILSRRGEKGQSGDKDNIDINISNAGGEKIIITIRDTGGGIQEDIIDRVFDAHFTTKPSNVGTGIGLYMSKTIIENNMGWRLTVRNIEGGAEFKIEI